MLTPIKSGRYISIKADGKLHETVSKETEGAILREYKLKDGTEGSKWELLYKSIDATITNIQFDDTGDFGENLQITLSDGENEVILSESVATNFGTDIMKKLPNVDFSKEVGIQPYAFEGNNGKLVKGVSIWQKLDTGSDKIPNFFWDDEKKEALHGFQLPLRSTRTCPRLTGRFIS